jgi:hypothetical protein
MHIFSGLPIVAVVVVVFLVIIGALLRLVGKATKPLGSAPTYEAIHALLTPAERSFFGVLQQALASDYQIFAKVRLADIVRPVRSPSRSGWQSAFNRITGKHVDFVLCDSERLGIVATTTHMSGSSAEFVTAWWTAHLQMLAFRFYEFPHVRHTHQRRFVSRCRVYFVRMRESQRMLPSKLPEPTALGAVRSAVAVRAARRRWLRLLRWHEA